MRTSGAKNVSFYNTVICHAWKDFVQQEREELLNTGVNTTTSYWPKTGYSPFNPNPEAWKNVLSTIGRLNKEMNKVRTVIQWRKKNWK